MREYYHFHYLLFIFFYSYIHIHLPKKKKPKKLKKKKKKKKTKKKKKKKKKKKRARNTGGTFASILDYFQLLLLPLVLGWALLLRSRFVLSHAARRSTSTYYLVSQEAGSSLSLSLVCVCVCLCAWIAPSSSSFLLFYILLSHRILLYRPVAEPHSSGCCSLTVSLSLSSPFPLIPF